jgi:glutathione reductase (NADPH)
MQVPSACFVQPPLAYVGYTEEEAIKKFSGNIDVYVSKFKPMKNTISGRDERTFMKLLVQADTDQVDTQTICSCEAYATPDGQQTG